MEAVYIKMIVIIVTLIQCLVFGLMPLRIVDWMKRTDDRERRFNLILSFLTCFSGGIFLGAVLIHLFPEVFEDFNKSLRSMGIVTEYPVSFLVICLGLFLVLLLEKLVIAYKLNIEGSVMVPKDDTVTPDQPSDKENLNTVSNEKDHSVSSADTVFLYDNTEKATLLATTESESDGGLPRSTMNNYMAIEEKQETKTSLMVKNDSVKPNSANDGSLKITSTIRSFVLLMALVLHSIFEGLAIGLQTIETEIYALFIAIVSHKFVEAFSLGLEMAQAVGLSSRTRIRSMITFSLMTPIGIAIGMLIVDTGDGQNQSIHMVSSVLRALATGTFLYVTFFEILPKELSKKRTYDLVRVLMVMIGFGFMAGIKSLEN